MKKTENIGCIILATLVIIGLCYVVYSISFIFARNVEFVIDLPWKYRINR
jgi:hypothetical protein